MNRFHFYLQIRIERGVPGSVFLLNRKLVSSLSVSFAKPDFRTRVSVQYGPIFLKGLTFFKWAKCCKKSQVPAVEIFHESMVARYSLLEKLQSIFFFLIEFCNWLCFIHPVCYVQNNGFNFFYSKRENHTIFRSENVHILS